MEKNEESQGSQDSKSEKKKRRFSLTNADNPKEEKITSDVSKTKTLSKVQLKHLTADRTEYTFLFFLSRSLINSSCYFLNSFLTFFCSSSSKSPTGVKTSEYV